MSAQDRLFGEIAVRLQLLTREQVAACLHEQETDPTPARLGEVACRLGLLSADDMNLVLTHQEAILKRRREGRVTQEVDPPPPSASMRGTPEPNPPRPAEPARPRTPPQPAQVPERSDADSEAYDFGTGSHASPAHPGAAVDALGATRLQGRPHEPNAATSPDAPGASPNTTLVEAFGQAVQSARARRRAFGADWRNPSEPPGPAQSTANEAAAAAHGGAAQSPRGTMIQNHGAVAAQEAEAARQQAAARAAASAAGATQGNATQGGATQGNATQGGAAPNSANPALASGPAGTPSAAAGPKPNASADPKQLAVQRPGPAGGAIADSYLGKALRMAVQHGASDLHAHSGSPIKIRIDGVLRPLSSGGPLTAEAAQKVIAAVMSDAQWSTLRRTGQVDYALSIPGLARFRVNVYRQQRGLDAVFRIIPLQVPTFESLGLPARLAKLADFRTGMVLFTGPAGSGKSTSLAALIGVLMGARRDHLLTIENPVEFVFPPGPCLINQRQVGDHTESFARALRAALREDPDIIAITELRDRETMELAISAAETGHLVLGTLHTGSAGQTISRIVSSFPAQEQEQVRVMLSESLRAVVSQRLVPLAAGKGRVPAIELMMVNTAVSNLIRDDKTHQLPSVMQTGKAAGMITLDDSLAELVQSGTITPEHARRHAVKKERFAG